MGRSLLTCPAVSYLDVVVVVEIHDKFLKVHFDQMTLNVLTPDTKIS